MAGTVKATYITEPGSATNNITLDTNGNMTTAGTVAMSTPFTMRNKIINGAMVIDQRNAGASITANSGTYPADRWQTYATQSSKLTAQQSTTVPPGFKNSIIYTSSSAYSVLAGDYFSVTQRIEGFNVADLNYGSTNAVTTTLSFWVRSSLTGVFGGACHNNAFNRVYPFTYTISAANTWQYVTIVIPGDTTGTWTTDNSVGLEIGFSLGCGSTGLGTAGAWAGTANIFGATGQTNLVGTNGATFYITGVQLERGTVATPFEYRNYQQELAMCRRYYKSKGGSYYTQFLGAGTSGYNQGYTISLNTTMRIAPTVTVYDGVPTAGKIYFNGNGVTVNVDFITTDQFRIYATTPSTGAITFAFDWEASAEL